MVDIEKIIREKMRFPLGGMITAEDVYDLPLKADHNRDLNTLAGNLKRRIEGTKTEDFVGESNDVDKSDEIMFEFVTHVIELKKAERNAAAKKEALKEERERLLKLYAQKQYEAEGDMSMEDIGRMLEQNEEALKAV